MLVFPIRINDIIIWILSDESSVDVITSSILVISTAVFVVVMYYSSVSSLYHNVHRTMCKQAAAHNLDVDFDRKSYDFYDLPLNTMIDCDNHTFMQDLSPTIRMLTTDTVSAKISQSHNLTIHFTAISD